MNDSGHVFDIVMALADAGERLHLAHEPDGDSYLAGARSRVTETAPEGSIRDAVEDLARTRTMRIVPPSSLTSEYERITADRAERDRVRRSGSNTPAAGSDAE